MAARKGGETVIDQAATRKRHLPHPWVLADQIRDYVGWAADVTIGDMSEEISAAAKLTEWLDLQTLRFGMAGYSCHCRRGSIG